MEWYTEVLKKYAVFSGRARRKEYWVFTLVSMVISVVLGIIDKSLGFGDEKGGMGLLGAIYSLAVLVPGLAVTVRRLHDTGRSGWWILISLVPCVGFIILLVFLIQDGHPGPNEYGPNPKEATDLPPYNPYG
jgi:uncharacterized membrane protein YhaH (DUF805 family)